MLHFYLRPLDMHVIYVRSNSISAFEPFFTNITLSEIGTVIAEFEQIQFNEKL